MNTLHALSKLKKLCLILVVGLLLVIQMPSTAFAAPHDCGSGENVYTPSIEVGCKGKGDSMTDFAFAIIRFLSIGVGMVLVASMVYAGIQYIGARGDPNAHAQAMKRIGSNVSALLIFIFAYALVNYVVPGQLLK